MIKFHLRRKLAVSQMDGNSKVGTFYTSDISSKTIFRDSLFKNETKSFIKIIETLTNIRSFLWGRLLPKRITPRKKKKYDYLAEGMRNNTERILNLMTVISGPEAGRSPPAVWAGLRNLSLSQNNFEGKKSIGLVGKIDLDKAIS